MALTDKLRSLLSRGNSQAREEQDFLRGEADMIDWRVDRYRLFDEYADGEQRTRLNGRARMYLQASGLTFSENFCETIIDTMADRMKVVGLQVEDYEVASDWLNKRMWPQAAMDETQGVVHTETAKLGDGFLIVDWDAKQMRPRVRWNRPHIIKPTYDDGNMDLLRASKVWATDQKTPTNPDGRLISRLNVYYEDRVEKWFTIAAGDDAQWLPHMDEGDASWPVWWTSTGMEGGDPLGIPVVHFRNKPKGRAFGRSELRGVLPFQDELNKHLLDLNDILDTMAWGQRYATGIGEGETVKVAIGDYLRAADPAARFGKIDAEDPAGVLSSIEALLTRMAAKSRTPLHDLSMKGEVPSGEALKTANAGQVSKVLDREVTHSQSWKTVAQRAISVQNAFGDETVEVDPDANITVVWENPETRDEQREALTFQAHHDLGVSRRTLLRKLGYDPEEEAKFRAEEDAEMAPPPPTDPVDLPHPGDEPAPVG